MRKCRKMIYKEKSSRIIVSGIIPRLHIEDKFYNDAISTNRQLAELCTREEVGCVNTWHNFSYDSSLFSYDGVHLYAVGDARFGRLLDDAVKDFRRNRPTRANVRRQQDQRPTT